jgi:hypothetical protein
MNKVLPVFLAFAAMSVAAPTSTYAAQDPAPASTQANDPEAAANEAYKAWKAETDPAKKHAMTLDIVKNHYGSKAAEAVAYADMFGQGVADNVILETSRVYYDTSKTASKEGQYVEYALGNIATREKEPKQIIVIGQEYLQKYPSGKFVEYVKPAVARARYNIFDTAIKSKAYSAAIDAANESITSGQLDFPYAYQITYAALGDLSAQGAKSFFVGKATPWAERAAKYVESGQMPEGTKAEEWAKSKPTMLATFYRVQGMDKFFQTASSNPADPAAYDPAIALLQKSASAFEKDATTYYFVAQARGAQYAKWLEKYNMLTEEEKTAEPGTAMLENVNKAADALIDSYIKVLAYSGNNQQLKSTIEPALAEVYKYRHPDTPEAWRDEVQKLNGGGAGSTNAK